MGSPGCSEYEAVLAWLSGELEMLLVGLGMWDFDRDGPEIHCFLWGFCCCWAGLGKLKWIGHKCSLVLWYLLPLALMI